jgi:hypothetical protein
MISLEEGGKAESGDGHEGGLHALASGSEHGAVVVAGRAALVADLLLMGADLHLGAGHGAALGVDGVALNDALLAILVVVDDDLVVGGGDGVGDAGDRADGALGLAAG